MALAEPSAAPAIGVKFTPVMAGRTVAAAVLTTLGVYYLGKGKQQADAGKMIKGAMFVLAGMACFL